MRRMGNKIFKYLKIYCELLKMNFMTMLEYRVDLFSVLLPTLGYSFGYLVFLNVILTKVPTVAGWNYNNMLLIFALEQFSYYLSWILYRESLFEFTFSVRDGSFDSIMKFPFSPRFITSFRKNSLNVLLPSLFAIILVIYALQGISLTVSMFLLGIFLFFCGVIILYNLLFTVSAVSFWTIESKDLIDLFDEFTSFARYPGEIFPGPVKFILLLVAPVLLFAYVPATAILGFLDGKLAILSVTMVAITWLVSEKVWQAGLRHYSSASS